MIIYFDNNLSTPGQYKPPMMVVSNTTTGMIQNILDIGHVTCKGITA